MKHLIVLGCKKQVGKTTSAAAIYAWILVQRGIFPAINIHPITGALSVIYDKEKNEGIKFDIDDDSPEMINFKEENVWAHVKHVSFADALKESICRLFSIPKEQVYGTNEQKNTLTDIKINDIWNLLPDFKKEELTKTQAEFITTRQLMEIFGTEVCRSFDNNCHIKSAYNSILESDAEIGIIPDMRFENEFLFFEKLREEKPDGLNVILIKLNRENYKSDSKSNAKSEQGIPEVDDTRYDLVLHNEGLSVLQKNEEIIKFLIHKGVLSSVGISRVEN